ncbi:MAG: hypothetical protein JXR84_20355 [Anaerolineae bacterium]|nr:hypothetical protein [Anaerolineae bacterium]
MTLYLDGWLFWRPKTQDGITFYNTAYWYEHGTSILIRSTDGIHWEKIATIYQGGRNDETEIEFLSDGRMLATARLEYGEKRTSLFEVREDGLAYLTDLPSAGDTSYVGLIVDGDIAYATYYTSRVDRDYPWILGMLSPSSVVLAKLELPALEALADKTAAR